MNNVDLFKLYGKYKGDISTETNELSNLKDEEILRTLKENYKSVCERTNFRLRKNKGKVFYHKVLINSSRVPRDKERREGFYQLVIGSNKKYYTSFKKLVKASQNLNVSITSWYITQNYSNEGGFRR